MLVWHKDIGQIAWLIYVMSKSKWKCGESKGSVGLTRQANFFLLRSQNKETKETKEKATHYCLFPVLFKLNGRQAETRFAQTVACLKPQLNLCN